MLHTGFEALLFTRTRCTLRNIEGRLLRVTLDTQVKSVRKTLSHPSSLSAFSIFCSGVQHFDWPGHRHADGRRDISADQARSTTRSCFSVGDIAEGAVQMAFNHRGTGRGGGVEVTCNCVSTACRRESLRRGGTIGRHSRVLRTDHVDAKQKIPHNCERDSQLSADASKVQFLSSTARVPSLGARRPSSLPGNHLPPSQSSPHLHSYPAPTHPNLGYSSTTFRVRSWAISRPPILTTRPRRRQTAAGTPGACRTTPYSLEWMLSWSDAMTSWISPKPSPNSKR